MPSATCCFRIWALTSAQLVVDILATGLVLDEGRGFDSLPMSW